jgi:hypothetical protein
MLVGYARVSTADQSRDLQPDALKNAGCKRVFAGGVGAMGLLPALLLIAGCSGEGGAAVDAGGEAEAGDLGTQVVGDAGEAATSLVTVPLSACDPTAYVASVTIGGSQTFNLLLDTGSTTLGVAGSGCASCSAAGASSLYHPGPTATDEHQTVDAGYGALAASGWAGEVYQDTVSTGAPAATAPVRFADIQQQTSFLVGACGASRATPDGVLGFAPAKTALPGTNGFFDQLLAEDAVADVFAVELCYGGGTLWLGGYDPAFTTAPPVYTPMSPVGFDAYVYTVDLASITVAGNTVPVPTGSYTAALLDTGSSISWVPPAAFGALTSSIATNSAFSQIFGAAASTFFSDPSTCVALTQTKAELDSALPPLTLTFGSSPAVSVQAAATESYLLELGDGRWCPAITPRTPNPSFQSVAASLGAPILRSNVVIFDRASHRVGFAPHKPCN